MSYKSKSQSDKEKDRELEIKMEEAALAVAEKEQPSSTAKVDVKGIQKELGANFTAFANSDENYRKRMLKDEYEAKKLKYGWLYDQKIE